MMGFGNWTSVFGFGFDFGDGGVLGAFWWGLREGHEEICKIHGSWFGTASTSQQFLHLWIPIHFFLGGGFVSMEEFGIKGRGERG